MTTNPTPKDRFQSDKARIENHRNLIERDDFILACDYALLQYQREICTQSVDNLNNAMANQFKLAGAQEFLRVFRTLAESTQPSPHRDRDNLNYGV
jgi:hypothetical protein